MTESACSTTNFSFSEALTWLKNGYRVAREGWNGKGQFIYLVPEGAYAPCTPAAEKLVNGDGLVPYGAYLAIKTVQGNVVPWLASQTDLLANDWMIAD